MLNIYKKTRIYTIQSPIIISKICLCQKLQRTICSFERISFVYVISRSVHSAYFCEYAHRITLHYIVLVQVFKHTCPHFCQIVLMSLLAPPVQPCLVLPKVAIHLLISQRKLQTLLKGTLNDPSNSCRTHF